jgi:hypothetical protein
MFKGFNNRQQHGFPNLIFRGDISAYGFGGVSFWLDAAFGLNTQTNLGGVSYWMPRVGASPFIQNTAGNQPRLILNDANYNNFPSVESFGIQSARRMDAVYGLRINPQITVAVVSKVNTIETINGIIGTQFSTSFPTLVDGGTNANYNGFGFFSNVTTPILQGTTESTNPRIKILTSTDIIINGVVETTGSLGTQAIELTRLFMASGVASTNMVGSIAEIITFDYSMTQAQAQQLSSNINSKYAIY